jgi:hypothetical protein
MAKIKKAQAGYKSRSVERSPDGNYKLVTKEKSGPGNNHKSVVKEKRTLKGLLKGAPRPSKLNRQQNQQVVSPLPEYQMSKNGSRVSAKKSISKISKKKK